MLTGQEQYYWERAGYFIRRKLLDVEGLGAWQRFIAEIREGEEGPVEGPQAVGVIRELVQELLGPQPLSSKKQGVPIGPEWSRGYIRGNQLRIDSTPVDLAGAHKCVTVCIASEADELLQVVPGSHAEPLAFDQLIMLKDDLSASLPGQITLRLSAGDAEFFSPSLLRRRESRATAISGLIFLDFYI